MNKLNINC